MKVRVICFFLLSIILNSCVPPSAEVVSDVEVDVEDVLQKSIIEYQDRQLVDSLYPYLSSSNPTHRYLVLRAFCSIQDVTTIDSIIPCLQDDNMDVRGIAAYALGQIRDEKAIQPLIENFIAQDTLDIDNILNGNILEALGKVGNEAIMSNIANVETYRPDDTLLILGQARSLYRFGLQKIINQDAVNSAVKYTVDQQYPTKTRVMAANILARNSGLDLTIHRSDLFRLLKREQNPHIRMAVALALRNFNNDPSLLDEVWALYQLEKDYRVKVYYLKALSTFPYINVAERMLEEVKDKERHVALTAAQFLVDKGNGSDSPIYKEVISEDLHWRVRAKVYEALFKHTPLYYTRVKNKLTQEVLDIYKKSDNVYERSLLIEALSRDPYAYKKLIELLSGSDSQVIKTASTQGLKSIVEDERFIRAFGGNYIRTARTIVDSIIVQSKEGYVGVTSILGELLQNQDFQWGQMIRDTSWKEEILSALKLPRDIEAFDAISAGIAAIEGSEFQKKPPSFNHPIDWTVLSMVTDSSTLVMKTTKGNLSIKLFKDKAPGSVANFINLCQSDYYDGKVFHRVVPNFVVQGGCPIGDGYGGLDYTIRSELSPSYYDDEGYIGMASAGIHTEGVQFFITHSPTPHLDGRYTIFGKVVEGMNVVHDLEMGDKIVDAILIK